MSAPAALEGPTVRLRPARPEDAPRILGWYSDPERSSPFDRFAIDRADGIAAAIGSAATDPRSLAPRFLIVPRATDTPVGCVGHYAPHPVLEYLEVWYLVGAPEARGHGYGSEAVGLLIDHLFRVSSVERIGANCDVANAASVRLLEHLGLRREGAMAAALRHHARWHEVAIYGITRSEWAARRGRTPPASPSSDRAA